ncbi:arsenical-resistance protein [Candidatus Heimdallarchaeota archaeon B3_Heim]|nr:MAG: arsenical-resistance protein [Candidatus Heimdallarchaeota archaeon B3_Heim]
METHDSMAIKHDKEESALSLFEKYLVVWIPLCMLAGILLSQYLPWISETIDNIQIRGISIPIGICLFLMMYPAVLNLTSSELRKLGRNPKPIILTLFSNWIVAPIVGLVLANFFLAGNDELITAIILLSASPCTAMVLVWGLMAEGNQEQNVVNTSLNTITIMVLYAPLVTILTGIQNIPIDRVSLALSVIMFIGLPIFLGLLSRNYLISQKGDLWFNETYRPIIGKVAIVALLITLILLFALNGNTLIENPELLVLVSIPLLLGFVIVVGFNMFITRIFRLQYKEAIITVIIGSSSHFEIAIATAIAVYGLGSVAALGTTMGLFWEIPIMLSIVYMGKYLGKRAFWNTEAKT